jgi:organic radical activating enzyme
MTHRFVLHEIAAAGIPALHDYMKSLHQAQYAHDYRIIIDYRQDVFTNPDRPGLYLTNLVRILSEIDISGFFVEIHSTYKHVIRDLTDLQTIYHVDAITVMLSAYEFIAEQKTSDTFCIEPWIHLYLNPQGQINPCCMADMKYPLGNYLTDPIDFNSLPIVEFRKTLLSGYQAPQCTSCYRQEQQGIVSARQQANVKFARYIDPAPAAVVQDFKLRRIDVRLNNVCNLKCRMCSGQFSNRIAQEDFEIWGATEYLRTSNSTTQDQKICDLIENQINNIDNVYFAGGEPLINETHYKILQMLIDYDKTSVDVFYNTNFSLLRYKQYNILDFWKKLNCVTIGASIDLIGPAADYVRNGVDYVTLEQNYHQVQNQCPNVRFEIHSTLSLYNAFNLCDLQKHWIDVIGLSPGQIKFNLLFDPNYLAISVLPKEIKNQVSDRVSEHVLYLERIGAQQLAQSWKNAVDIMNRQDNSYLLPKFFQINDARDQYRKQQFEDYFPEYHTLRNYLV